MSDLSTIFGRRLLRLRQNAGMSQTELSALINSTKVQISRYENGLIVPSVETLVTIANAFDCSTDYLLGRSETTDEEDEIREEFSPEERAVITALREGEITVVLRLLWMLVDEIETLRKFPYYTLSASTALRIRKQSRGE